MNKVIKNWLLESFISLNEDLENDKFVKQQKKQIYNAISDKLKNDETLRKKADEIGINPEFDKKKYIQSRTDAFKGLHISGNVTDKVKKAIELLKSITSQNTGQNWFNELKHKCENGESYGITYNEVLRLKDFIDSQDLRYLYDGSIDPRSKKTKKFGISWDKNGNIDDSDFDLDTITNSHLHDWLKGGSRKEKYTEDEAYIEAKRGIIDKYLMSSYGINFDAPNFSLGNKKVKDALLINFTSAFRCPAWNECLVKHACYARSGEGTYYHNEKLSNDKKHLMWEAGHNDPQLMHMIHNLLKAYVVDYTKVSKNLNSVFKSLKKNGSSEFISKLGKTNKIDKLIDINFSEMPNEMLEMISEHVRVKDIRLNENGDFIGQWLLTAIDDIASDFKLIGVNTAAYSCRNLKFDKIKNIIINASRMEMEGPTIARYFYALPEKMYDAFEDTYVGKGISDEFNAIGRTPKPLFIVDEKGNKKPNGHYYYKCPCGREDFTVNGKKLEKVNCYQCHLCYEKPDSEITNKLKNGGKYFVFVKAHGTKANLLDDSREAEIIRKVGVPYDYKVGSIRDDGKNYVEDPNLDIIEVDDDFEDGRLGESLSYKNNSQYDMENEAYETITDNAISSMNEHLGGISLAENNIREQREKFNKIFNKIK